MKDKFPGYYPLSAEEAKELWINSGFVFDTCSLLNLYSYSQGTRDELLKVLETIKERLWMPHQVAAELHKNRSVRISREQKSYTETIKLIDGFQTGVKEKHNSKRQHPFISETAFNGLMSAIEKVQDEMSRCRDNFERQLFDDPLFDHICLLFDGRVGERPAADYVKDVIKQGRERYKDRVPPGYEDDKEKPEPDKFGDLMLWLQVIDYSKEQKRSIILVTDDDKEDWWRYANNGKGKLLGPRPELITEFVERTGQKCWIYNSEVFLKYARTANLNVSASTIDEVQNAAMANRQERLTGTATSSANLAPSILSMFNQIWEQHNAATSEAVNAAYRSVQLDSILEKARRNIAATLTEEVGGCTAPPDDAPSDAIEPDEG